MIGFGYWHGNCLGAGRGPGMGMILGNLQNGRGEAIGGGGMVTYQPRHENRATGRFGAFPGIPREPPTAVFRPPPHHTRNPRGFPFGPDIDKPPDGAPEAETPTGLAWGLGAGRVEG